MSVISSEALRRLDAVVRVGLRVAQSARSGRVALAQLREQLEDRWIPRPWGDDIVAALDEAARVAYEPLALRDVERVLRDAWDGSPSEELDDLEPEPAAVTPGAQVHRATLDGRAVAVKVLRPGLATTVRQDLTLLETLAGPLEAAFPAVAISASIGEVRERVLDELDLETEATVQRRFHRALRDHPFLSVPAPVTSLCRESVKVAEWVDGVPLHEAPNRDEAAARLVVFVLGAARWGVAYADPSNENVLVREDGGLAVVDFGACREIDRARLADATAVLEAASNDDAAALARHVGALGWLPESHAPAALEVARHALGELLEPGPSRLDRDSVRAAGRRLGERRDDLATLIPAGSLAPEDLWPARSVAQLFGTIARLEAECDWLELALDALRDGW